MYLRFVLSVSAYMCIIACFSQSASAQTFEEKFGHAIDLQNLDNYAAQSIPNYINRDNTTTNPITDDGATLGRILFYDKNLSVNRTVSCASCHDQLFAFSDDLVQSVGENGLTGRHSMRLINARFSQEPRFFWDERAATLEDQTTQPIQDHAEMGFSGQLGNPDLNDLITRLSDIEYYQELFTLVYGDPVITEARMQNALAQFVRSIQSFDSKYDAGRAQVGNNNNPFPNFTNQENQGKQLFQTRPQFNGPNRIGGGVGCARCHQPPEFSINPNSGNNGVVAFADGSSGSDLTNTRSPTIRDVFSPAGGLNTQMMHNGLFDTMGQVLAHYDSPPLNPQLDNRLQRGGNRMQLNITGAERSALVAFMQTLTGSNVYADPKWSDPFEGAPPVVAEMVVGDDVPQRSMVNSLTVIFDTEVDASASSFTLTNTTTATEVTTVQAASDVFDGQTWVTLTFAAGDSVVTRAMGNSLDDGIYMLEVLGDQVTTVEGDVPMGDDHVSSGIEDGLFRLYGDADGNAFVDVPDLFDAFSPAFNSNSSSGNYVDYLDANGDGFIDVTDLFDYFAPNFNSAL